MSALPSRDKKEPKVISFELKVPKLKKPDLPYRRIAIMGAALLAVLLIAAAVVSGVKLSKQPPAAPAAPVSGFQQATPPPFDTLGAKTPEQTQKGVSYEPQKGVASFADKISGVEVIVSQQPLPDQFKQNPKQEVENLAKSFKASKVLEAKGTQAFYGTSSLDGYQTVIFTKKDLLIFIRAQQELDKDALTQYIVNLN